MLGARDSAFDIPFREGAVRMKRTLLLAGVLTSATIVVIAAIAPAAGAASTLRVCKSGCPFTTIQAAIDAASSDSTIRIEPATYNENLKIGPSTATPLTLIGTDPQRVIIDGQQKDSVLTVSPNKAATLNGLTLQHGKVTGNGGGIS